MQRKKLDWRGLGAALYPFLPPLCAIILLVLQPVYAIRGDAALLLNLLLFSMELAEFFPLFVKERRSKTAMHVAGMGMITFMAVLYNIKIACVPVPISDAAAFLTSWYGMWSAAVVLEFMGLGLWTMWRINEKEKRMRQGSATEPAGAEQPNSGLTGSASVEQPEGGAAAEPGDVLSKSSHTDGQGRKPHDGERTGIKMGISFGAKTIGGIFWLGGILLPFLPIRKFSGWLQTVREISEAVYGPAMKQLPDSVAIIAYFIFLFAVVVGGYVLWQLSLYMVERLKNRGAPEKGFYSEYSTPITLLVVVGVLAISSRQVTPTGSENVSDWLELAGQLFAWIFVLIVGIIAAFVMFETTRLILKQCLDTGSLLQTSMHLIFVLVVEYVVGFLMGLLRAFALKNVVESILSFFFPDLEDAISPRVSRVFRRALEREVGAVSQSSQEKHAHNGDGLKCGWRYVRRGGAGDGEKTE